MGEGLFYIQLRFQLNALISLLKCKNVILYFNSEISAFSWNLDGVFINMQGYTTIEIVLCVFPIVDMFLWEFWIFLINNILHYTIFCNIISPTVYETVYLAELLFSEYLLERTFPSLYSHETNWNVIKATF
jgi:hypothetical protein